MFYKKTIEEIFAELNTNELGLTNEEAVKRLNEYGKNQLPKKKKDSVIKIFFNELKDPIVLLLLLNKKLWYNKLNQYIKRQGVYS